MSGRYFFGLILLIIGVVYLLQIVQVIPGNTLSIWWPLLIVIYGLNQLIRYPRRPEWALIILLLGAILQLSKLGMLPKNLWALVWAFVLIAIGIRLLVPHRRLQASVKSKSQDRLNESLTFGTTHYRDESQQFQGGKINATFGDYELDLRGAKLSAVDANLDLNVTFGNILVRVPMDWSVLASGTPIFGSCTNKTSQVEGATTGKPVLRVKCSAQFGSVEITN